MPKQPSNSAAACSTAWAQTPTEYRPPTGCEKRRKAAIPRHATTSPYCAKTTASTSNPSCPPTSHWPKKAIPTHKSASCTTTPNKKTTAPSTGPNKRHKNTTPRLKFSLPSTTKKTAASTCPPPTSFTNRPPHKASYPPIGNWPTNSCTDKVSSKTTPRHSTTYASPPMPAYPPPKPNWANSCWKGNTCLPTRKKASNGSTKPSDRKTTTPAPF